MGRSRKRAQQISALLCSQQWVGLRAPVAVAAAARLDAAVISTALLPTGTSPR
jgi:hypothetical protein